MKVPGSTATEPQFLNLAELMERWGVKRTTIYNEIKRKKIRRRHIGGCVRFHIDDVLAYEKAA